MGSLLLASELARRVGQQGILSVAQNPGNLKTNLLRHTSKWVQWAVSPLLYGAKMDAYTEIWAGLSPDLTVEMEHYLIPWGRVHQSPRQDLLDALKSVEEGGNRASEWILLLVREGDHSV